MLGRWGFAGERFSFSRVLGARVLCVENDISVCVCARVGMGMCVCVCVCARWLAWLVGLGELEE